MRSRCCSGQGTIGAEESVFAEESLQVEVPLQVAEPLQVAAVWVCRGWVVWGVRCRQMFGDLGIVERMGCTVDQ